MHLGVQLFTLRDLMDKDFAGTLRKVSECGYRFVETAGLHGRSPEAYREELDRAGLRAIACHVGLPEVEDELDSNAATAHTLGAEWLVVPWVPKGVYAGGWAKFGERLGAVAAKVIKKGLKFAYHNHAFEFEEEGDAPGYEHLWAGAPETVESELDVYWAHYAGQDPSDWLRKLAGRVPLAHFKDGKDDKFTPVGEGVLDWKAIISAAELAGVQYAIVELDECPRDGIDCVAVSFTYLNGLGVSR
jgi:sugar phosphate isomerase/epimerase